MAAIKEENHQLVVDWCKSVGVDASNISDQHAVLYRHDGDEKNAAGSVCFQFREFVKDEDGNRAFCHGCGECGCGGDHYKMLDREIRGLPAPEFWPSDHNVLNLAYFARGFGY